MVALRDEIGEARLEDVPGAGRADGAAAGGVATRGDLQTILVDPASPYFGHLRLRERSRGRGEVERDVLIGRATFVDAAARVNIVDWRHAPVSQLFYRYAEGSDYEERFGDRDVEGDIVARRTLTIEGGVLLRVACPQGVWARARVARCDRVPGGAPTCRRTRSRAAQDTAARPARGVLGAAPAGRQALDRHLPEIAALIDPRQFDVITAPDAGVVVIQGGAGSGKTTVGLHRLAYLAYNHPDRISRRAGWRSSRTAWRWRRTSARCCRRSASAACASGRSATSPSAGAARRDPVAARRASSTRRRPRSRASRATPRCCTSWSVSRRRTAASADSRAAVELWADLLTDRGRLLALLRDAARDAGRRARRRSRRTRS